MQATLQTDYPYKKKAIKHCNKMALLGLQQLTTREKDCLSLWLLGNTMAIIGEILSISPRTVETHLYNARGKLQQKTRQSLMLWLIDVKQYDHFIEYATNWLKKYRALRERHGYLVIPETLK